MVALSHGTPGEPPFSPPVIGDPVLDVRFSHLILDLAGGALQPVDPWFESICRIFLGGADAVVGTALVRVTGLA